MYNQFISYFCLLIILLHPVCSTHLKMYLIYHFLGGQSGRRQHLTQAPPLQRQAVRRGYVWVLGHRLQRQRGAAPPRSCSPPGGSWQHPAVRRGQAVEGGAAVTGEPSGGPSPHRRPGAAEIHRNHLWLYWQLWAVEFTLLWGKVAIGTRVTQPSDPPRPRICSHFLSGLQCCWAPVHGMVLSELHGVLFLLLLCALHPFVLS